MACAGCARRRELIKQSLQKASNFIKSIRQEQQQSDTSITPNSVIKAQADTTQTQTKRKFISVKPNRK